MGVALFWEWYSLLKFNLNGSPNFKEKYQHKIAYVILVFPKIKYFVLNKLYFIGSDARCNLKFY
jgi:hypothetical protein